MRGYWFGGVALAALATVAMAVPAAERDTVYPADARVVNVREFGAKGDGKTDDTAAIQKVLNTAPRLIYFPNGTYLISDTLRWGGTGGGAQKRIVFQGQSRERTVIFLKDRCPGYGDPAQPKAMIWTGEAPAQRFRNGIRNLTVDTGKGNPGAIGVQYIANNQGTLREVTIRSGDGSGVIGLDLGYTNEQGPCLIKNVRVTGFDTGIFCRHAVDSVTMENIVLENQSRYGLHNDGQCVSIEGFTSTNAVPAIYNTSETSLIALFGAKLNGKGQETSRNAAIINEAAMYLRDVQASGYAQTVRKVAEGRSAVAVKDKAVSEYVSHAVSSLFPSPQKALHLPVRKTPTMPNDDLKDWVSPTHFGAVPNDDNDDTEAIQKAIDSGKTTLYFPAGRYVINGTVTVRGNVRRILGLESKLAGNGEFRFDASKTAPVVVFERFDLLYSDIKMVHNSPRTLVISSVTFGSGDYTSAPGSGDLFLEDVCAAPWHFRQQNVWARQFNTEGKHTKIINDNSKVWILGLKTEQIGTLVETKNGGATEIIGGFTYSNSGNYTMPLFITENASLSVTIGESNYNGTPWQVLAREVRNGATRELKRGEAPARGKYASMLPLYTAYPSDTGKSNK
ncbi:MAG: hypothetical protein OHK0029_39690 [Armatimonadaceae bacterium]